LTLFGVIQGLAEPAEQAEVWPKSIETHGYDDDDDDDDDDDKYFPQTFQTLGDVGAGDIFLVWLGVSARTVHGGIIVHHEIWYTSPKLWEY